MQNTSGCAPQTSGALPRRGRPLWLIAAGAVAAAAVLLTGSNIAAVVGSQVIWRSAVSARVETLRQELPPDLEIPDEQLRTIALEAIIHDMIWERIFTDHGVDARGPAGQEALRALIAEQIPVSDEEITSRLATFPLNVQRQHEQVSVRVILLPSQAEAEELAASLEDGVDEETFAAIAADRSIHEGTRGGGGLIGPAGRNYYPPEVEEILFSLPVGAVSPPIPWEGGYALFRIQEHIQAVPMSEAEMRREAETLVRTEKVEAEFQRVVAPYFQGTRIWRLRP